MKAIKKITIAKVQDKFNEFIRLRDADKGPVKCISCPAIVSLGSINASHYFSAGKHKSLRFNEDNCHVSCISCNLHLHGNLIEYRKGLLKKIGIDRLEKLEILAAASKRSTWEPMEFELKIIYDTYVQKIKDLKKSIEIPYKCDCKQELVICNDECPNIKTKK